MKYAIYGADGRIIQTATGTLQSVSDILQTEQLVVAVNPFVDPTTHYISGGVAVEFPTKPSEFHTWNWTTHVWNDIRSLNELKASRIELAKIARDRALYGGFTWDGSVFDSDSESQVRLLGVSVRADRDPTTVETWRLQDNTWRVLDATDIMNVWAVFEQHMRDCFQTFAILEAQILAATSAVELETLLWPA